MLNYLMIFLLVFVTDVLCVCVTKKKVKMILSLFNIEKLDDCNYGSWILHHRGMHHQQLWSGTLLEEKYDETWQKKSYEKVNGTIILSISLILNFRANVKISNAVITPEEDIMQPIVKNANRESHKVMIVLATTYLHCPELDSIEEDVPIMKKGLKWPQIVCAFTAVKRGKEFYGYRYSERSKTCW